MFWRGLNEKKNLPQAAHESKRLDYCNINATPEGIKDAYYASLFFRLTPRGWTTAQQATLTSLHVIWSESQCWTEEPGCFPALELFQKAVYYLTLSYKGWCMYNLVSVNILLK